jgi:hypothetical protein
VTSRPALSVIFLHPNHQRRVDVAGGNSHQRGTKRRRARGAGGFHFDGFLPPESDPIRKESPELVLPVDHGRKHVADEERVDPVHAGVLHGGKGGIASDLAQGKFPVLVDFCLTDSQGWQFFSFLLRRYFNRMRSHLLSEIFGILRAVIYNPVIFMKPVPSAFNRSSFFALFGVSLVWGYALWWSVSSFGLGTSRDSVEYLFTSLSLTRGDGLVSFLGQRYVLWPPLYPALLSILQMVGGMDPLAAALALQLLTFVWIAALTAWLFTRLFPRTFALAFLGNALALTGVGLTMLFQAVGSDYLFIALTLSMVYLCDAYLTENRLRTIGWMIVVSALAMLQRYIAVALLLTAAWVVFQYSRTSLADRLKRTALLGLSLLPVGIWALSLPVEAVVRNDPSNLFENFYWFTFSILSWFVPEAELYDHPFRTQIGMWGLWLGIIVCGVIVWRTRGNRNLSVETPLFLFGGIYTVLLLVIASLTSFNTLDSRFASTVFIPLAVLGLSAMEILLFSGFFPVKLPPALMYAVVSLPLLAVLGLSEMRSGWR